MQNKQVPCVKFDKKKNSFKILILRSFLNFYLGKKKFCYADDQALKSSVLRNIYASKLFLYLVSKDSTDTLRLCINKLHK